MNKTLLDGNFIYLTDQQSKLSFDQVLEIYKKKKYRGRMKVPSNWELQGLKNFNGSVWFFKVLKIKQKKESLYILEFKGSDYLTELWINSSFIGKHEGYFQSFHFDISDQVAAENLLIIKVTSPKEEPGTVWPLKKKLMKKEYLIITTADQVAGVMNTVRIKTPVEYGTLSSCMR